MRTTRTTIKHLSTRHQRTTALAPFIGDIPIFLFFFYFTDGEWRYKLDRAFWTVRHPPAHFTVSSKNSALFFIPLLSLTFEIDSIDTPPTGNRFRRTSTMSKRISSSSADSPGRLSVVASLTPGLSFALFHSSFPRILLTALLFVSHTHTLVRYYF